MKSMGNQWSYISDEKLMEYVSQDGKKLYTYTPVDGRPVGDGFFADPYNLYMGVGIRPVKMSCGSCSRVGFCQFCVNRWPV